jgi:nucleolar complex protein 2
MVKKIVKAKNVKKNSKNLKIKAKKPKVQKEKKKDDSKTNKQDENEQGNEADFYLDDRDADIAYDEGSAASEVDGSELDFGEEDYIESEEDEEEKPKEKKVTKTELKKLIKKTLSGSAFAIRRMIIIFSKISNPNYSTESLDDDNALNKPKIINKVIRFCIKNIPDILQLKINSQDKDAGSLKSTLKRYLSVLTRYLKTAEPPRVALVFKYIDNISEIILSYKNFIEVFLKLSIKIWAEKHGNNTSKSALNFTRKLIDKRPEYFETALKLFYVNYLDVAKAMNYKSITKISEMQKEIIRILSVDLDKTYITIFTFIRKLCLQLRATINDKKASSIKNIYNWQFVNSIKLWSEVVIAYYNHKNCEINLLAYPLIQTIFGVLRLNLVDVFYPLRLILINILNDISTATGLYIPVSNYLIEIVESSHFKNSFKEKVQADKEKNDYDLNVNLKLKKEDFKNYEVVGYLLEQTIDSLMQFVLLNSYRFTFPESMINVVHSLKKIAKETHVFDNLILG